MQWPNIVRCPRGAEDRVLAPQHPTHRPLYGVSADAVQGFLEELSAVIDSAPSSALGTRCSIALYRCSSTKEVGSGWPAGPLHPP